MTIFQGARPELNITMMLSIVQFGDTPYHVIIYG